MFGVEKLPTTPQETEVNNDSEEREKIQERRQTMDIIDYCKNNLTKFLNEHPKVGKTVRNVAFTTMSLGAVFNANSVFSQNVEKMEKDKIENTEVIVALPEINVEDSKKIIMYEEMTEGRYDQEDLNMSVWNLYGSGYLANSGKNVIIDHQSIQYDQLTEKDGGEKILSTMNSKIIISQGAVENMKTEGEPIRVKHVGSSREEAITNALAEASDQIGVMDNPINENASEENNLSLNNKITSFTNIKSSHQIASYRLISSINIENNNIQVEIEVIPYVE